MAESQACDASTDGANSTILRVQEPEPARRKLFPGLQVVSACLHPLKQAVLMVVSGVSNAYGRFKPCSWLVGGAPNDVEIVVKMRTESSHPKTQEQTGKPYQRIFIITKMLSFIDQRTPNSIKLLGSYSGAVFGAQMKSICESSRISEIWSACRGREWSLFASLAKVKVHQSCSSILVTWLLPSMLDAAEMFNYAVDYLKVHHFPLNAYIPMIPVEKIELAFEDEDSWASADSGGTLENVEEEDQNSETAG